MSILEPLLADLADVGDRLRAVVAPLAEDQWRIATPAEGWDIATQIAHLAWTDEASVLANRAATGDTAEWDALVTRGIANITSFVDEEAFAGAAATPTEILARWDAARRALPTALLAATGKLPWFGPPMSPASMATARLMETWAHGLDVYDALGITPVPTDAVRHIAHLGIRTRGFAYAAHHRDAPDVEIQVTLVLPSEEVVTWGPDDAPETITGTAWDFARLVTQRVHRDDTDLVATGPQAEEWLSIAQAFAGAPGAGRAPNPALLSPESRVSPGRIPPSSRSNPAFGTDQP